MAPEEPGDPPSLPGCGEFRPKHAHLEILVGSKQDGRSDQRWDFQVGLTYLCHLGKEAINEVSGRVWVKGSLVFTDAAGDEVLHASVVLKKASVWPGHPVQEVRKDIVHLRMEQSWRGWEEQAAAEKEGEGGCVCVSRVGRGLCVSRALRSGRGRRILWGAGSDGEGGANSNSFPTHFFPDSPELAGPLNPLAHGIRSPDLSPGAAHDLEVFIDEMDNGEQTVVVVVEAGTEDHRADNVGHGAAHHKRGVEGLA